MPYYFPYALLLQRQLTDEECLNLSRFKALCCIIYLPHFLSLS